MFVNRLNNQGLGLKCLQSAAVLWLQLVVLAIVCYNKCLLFVFKHLTYKGVYFIHVCICVFFLQFVVAI